ncbi:helix-turn-helix transcriptional regulator [Streptomyces sp. NPDC094447]|uniref:helix-turn-helix transcriptional regulator n=1 Tax=Streptomyces sp. NPDC094447 TaxID=3366062 RepID=UPI0037FEB66E
MSGSSGERPSWTFLTNHARVLVVIARDPGVRLRDVAAACGVTERTVQAIVADLEDAGYLTHAREGRRNRYRLAPGKRFRHPLEGDYEITGLLDLLKAAPRNGGTPAPEAATGNVLGSRPDEAGADSVPRPGLTETDPDSVSRPDATETDADLASRTSATDTDLASRTGATVADGRGHPRAIDS